MPIRPRVQEKEKKPLTQRDDFLMVLAFAVAGALRWFAGDHEGDLALALQALSYVVGAIGLIILLGIVRDATRRKHKH
jgi:hypothetical protein